MSSAKHVASNLRAFEAMADSQMVRQVKAILAPVSNYVWPSGRPENHDSAR
jgi:hypothetical protein